MESHPDYDFVCKIAGKMLIDSQHRIATLVDQLNAVTLQLEEQKHLNKQLTDELNLLKQQ